MGHEVIGKEMEKHGIASAGAGGQKNVGKENRRIGAFRLQVAVELIPFFNERQVRGGIPLAITLHDLFFHNDSSCILVKKIDTYKQIIAHTDILVKRFMSFQRLLIL